MRFFSFRFFRYSIYMQNKTERLEKEKHATKTLDAIENENIALKETCAKHEDTIRSMEGNSRKKKGKLKTAKTSIENLMKKLRDSEKKREEMETLYKRKLLDFTEYAQTQLENQQVMILKKLQNPVGNDSNEPPKMGARDK